MTPRPKSWWVIRHRNGTYYRCMTRIGPCFGATLSEAAGMSKEEAATLIGSSWKFIGSKAARAAKTEPKEER